MADDLFPTASPANAIPEDAPLAARMRPRTLVEFVGQKHLLASGKLLRRAIEADRVQSVIFFGPPGIGKTSLAFIIAAATKSRFERLSGVEASVADIRRVIAGAAQRRANSGAKTILFLDEIHRLNKAQQDVLLPDIENGVVSLIGATTHNPFFFVINALVSRSQVFDLKPLEESEIAEVVRRAATDRDRGLGALKLDLHADAIAHWAKVCDGDARKALNALEIAGRTTLPDAAGVVRIDRAVAEESIQKKAVIYDADEDSHYDTISAFIKSVRGSDPDASIYWLAKMLYAGEDIRFIARRLAILAAEDIGLADPVGLVLANACFQIVELIGMPEARIVLAETTLYLATAPKSNTSILAIDAALEDVKAGRLQEVPKALRDTHYKGSKKLGHGEGYQYSHDHPMHHVEQEFMPVKKKYYTPTEMGREKKIKEFMELLRQATANRRAPSSRKDE
ncbi:MAG: replication-associated recombination protein A [Verrucomicrobia bacterium]|nr:replication-associated recombination protein A [Verrucomicrobiota bacterium]